MVRDPSLAELLRDHYEEGEPHKDACPLDPDWSALLRLAEVGVYRVWTARDGPTLCGYACLFVQPHLHFRTTLHAVVDLVALSPAYRGHLYAMLSAMIPALREAGVKRVFISARPPGRLAKVYERLGFACIEHIYAMVL